MVRGNWLGVRSAMVAACATAVLAAFASTASAAAPDWTGDGAGDVVAVDSNGSLRVYRGSGTGLFTDAGPQIDGPGTDAWGQYTDVLNAGDFTGDGKPDLLARSADGWLRVFRGNGAGGLVDQSTAIGMYWNNLSLLVAGQDFTGDGKTDVIGRRSDGTLWLYPGDGAGGFINNGAQMGGPGWNFFTALFSPGDFSGDGKADVLARGSDGSMRIYRGDGAGGLGAGVVMSAVGWNGFTDIFAAGDFSGDGKPDVLARSSSGGLYVYRGSGLGSFADNGTLMSNGFGGFTALVGGSDFSGDGKPDVLGRDGGRLWMYRGHGLGGLKDSGQPFGGDWSTVTDLMAPGDFTGDGKPDLLARRTIEGTLRVHRGDGDGGFAESGTLIGNGWGGLTAVIAPGDFSGDGKPDVLARTPAGAMLMYRGDGAGGFVDNGILIGGGWNGFIDILPAGDFDSDGKPDVFGRNGSGQLLVYRGNGAGSFADNGTLIGNGWGGMTGLMAGGDFSGDGKPDVLARTPEGAMILYEGNGFGGFVNNGVQIGAQWNSFSKMVLVGGRRPQFENDALLLVASTGRVYLYAAGAVAWVTNATVAARLEYDLSTAINVPASVIASYRRAYDITEQELNSADEPSSGTGGEFMVAGHPKPTTTTSGRPPTPPVTRMCSSSNRGTTRPSSAARCIGTGTVGGSGSGMCSGRAEAGARP